MYVADLVLATLVVILAFTAMSYAIVDVPKSPGPHRGQSSFLVRCLLPMALATGLLGIYWAWNREVTGIPNSLSVLMTAAVLLHVITFVVARLRKRTVARSWTFLAAAASAAIGAVSVWWIEHRLFPTPLAHLELYTATEFPLVFLSIGVAGVLFIVIATAGSGNGRRRSGVVGAARRRLAHEARGWLATGAWCFGRAS